MSIKIDTKIMRRIEIVCDDDSYDQAIKHCSEGGYEIISCKQHRDGRSGKYLGQTTIIAEKPYR